MTHHNILHLDSGKQTKDDITPYNFRILLSLPKSFTTTQSLLIVAIVFSMNFSSGAAGPAPLYTTILELGFVSELIVVIAGIATTMILHKFVGLTVSRPLGWIYKKINSSIGPVSKNNPSVKAARWIAALVPDLMWQILTWILFGLGYASQCMSTWPSTMLYLVHIVALKYLPTQKLMLDIGWYSFTLYQSWSICQQEHQEYIALGGGGTPQTWSGFKRITMLDWFGKIKTLAPPEGVLEEGFLESLESRSGGRPTVVGIAPQRQLDQRSPQRVYDYLLTYLDHLSAENSSRIHTATSFLEKHSSALRANVDCVSKPIFRVFGCEIAHPHHVDGSLHCMLHPGDIQKVIRAGWGERHSIARDDSWWMWWFFATEERPPIPVDLCFIYAPRNEYEVCVVADIVEAGVKYVTQSKESEDGSRPLPLKGLVEME